jgi:hypothetical protein
MAGDPKGGQQLRPVCSGEGTAVYEWVRRYQAALFREIRLRLRDPRLRQALHNRNLWPALLGNLVPGNGPKDASPS